MDFAISRRTAAGLLTGAATGGGLIQSVSAKTHHSIPNDIAQWTQDNKVTALVKQQGRTDEGRVIWRFQGIIYGFKAPASPSPLVRFSGCEQQWWEPRGDGSFVRYSSLLTYFRDIDSGKIIRSFTNPDTGVTTDIKENWSRQPEGQEVSKRGIVNPLLDKAFPDFYAKSSVDDFRIRLIDGTVSFWETVRTPKELALRPYSQDKSFYASFEEIANPTITSARTRGGAYILMPSFANIGMNDPSQGQALWHVEFYKVGSLDDVESDYLEAAYADYGDDFEANPKFDKAPSKLGARLKKMGYL
jgi:hypothetical protein